MMKKFVKPSIVDCGKSESVIKGKSGWGAEGFTLDKVGSRMTNKFQSTHIEPGVLKTTK
ncbi:MULTISPECIES: hypothetical protein [Bacillus]|uniref:hypothetical protein n=1 Tax=Bacillus TaxID=1386 RepID=UPI000279742A|nr:MULTISPECIES: hypothetical protein [Bacillus cereus group]EJR04054.1 hypothetical protein II5_03761 [Bacillus cereus MSX-A1]MBV6678953.1 hypothetical protein [Bacillus thuringiensis]MCH5447001.1 hypothetical protein [Bacillus cereus]MEC3156499.1 hypothetical protein [Bacillus thuringiensis]